MCNADFDNLVGSILGDPEPFLAMVVRALGALGQQQAPDLSPELATFLADLQRTIQTT